MSGPNYLVLTGIFTFFEILYLFGFQVGWHVEFDGLLEVLARSDSLFNFTHMLKRSLAHLINSIEIVVIFLLTRVQGATLLI